MRPRRDAAVTVVVVVVVSPVVASVAWGAPDEVDPVALWHTVEVVVGVAVAVSALAGAWRVLVRPVQQWHARLDGLAAEIRRCYAALGLREDDTPLRDRVVALEAALDESTREAQALRAALERVEAQGAAVLAAVAPRGGE